jgi:hypothetical protein
MQILIVGGREFGSERIPNDIIPYDLAEPGTQRQRHF